MVYLEQSDETLVALTLAGNQRAYEGLVVRNQKKVLSAAYYVTHNWYMAEDAAQDAFVTAWMKLDLLKEPSKYGAWVCRIAANCAKRMLVRFREYLDIDILENASDWQVQGMAEDMIFREEQEEVRGSVGRLPEKIKEVIRLHYFEGLSIQDIARRTLAPEGTVKWQLHEGRKRLRKELGAMNENEKDSLVVKVMKKVQELKNWKLKNSKMGFEEAYSDVLREVEKLPESEDKCRALADTLLCGWWWIPGQENDALLSRIKEAAVKGRNEEVLGFVMAIEEEKLSGEDYIQFVLQTQIPFLNKRGFTKTLGREWFWLGCRYFGMGEAAKGYEAYERALSALGPEDVYYACTLSARWGEQLKEERYAAANPSQYKITCEGEEWRVVDGVLRFWSEPGYNIGYNRKGHIAYSPSYNVSGCDRYFYLPGLKVGETYTGSDGGTLTFAAKDVTAETACGRFEGCELWVTANKERPYRTFYKPGVGIVRQEREGRREVMLLSDYHIEGGEGLIPCKEGNSWKYLCVGTNSSMKAEQEMKMIFSDSGKAIVEVCTLLDYTSYDENCWGDMAARMINEYWREEDGETLLADVSPWMERMKQLAESPCQRAYTASACQVMERIFRTDQVFHPQRTQSGHWNFFQECTLLRENGAIVAEDDFCDSFEWKDLAGTGKAGYQMSCNDLMGILQDAAGCIWSDQWEKDVSHLSERMLFERSVSVQSLLREAGPVTTTAGTFEDCVELVLKVKGLDGGFAYRGGRKEYVFAKGVGIVRATHHRNQEETAVYELTSYTGSGQGYMPVERGFMRHYDAVGLTDGYVAYAEYTFEEDETGLLRMFEDKCGVRSL